MESLHQLFYPSYLIYQFIGHGRALCFILFEELVTEGRPFFIEGDGIVGRFQFAEHFKQHQGKAIDGADDLARFGDSERCCLSGTRRPEGMESPVDDSVAVKEHEKRFFHNPIITEEKEKE